MSTFSCSESRRAPTWLFKFLVLYDVVSAKKKLAKMTDALSAVYIPAAFLGSKTLWPWNDRLKNFYHHSRSYEFHIALWSKLESDRMVAGQYCFHEVPLVSWFCGGQVVYAWRVTCCVCEDVSSANSWLQSFTIFIYGGRYTSILLECCICIS